MNVANEHREQYVVTIDLEALNGTQRYNVACDKNGIAVITVLGVQLQYFSTIGICGGQSSNGTGFPLSTSAFIVSIIPAMLHTHSFIINIMLQSHLP